MAGLLALNPGLSRLRKAKEWIIFLIGLLVVIALLMLIF
jgi:hypothetical protein